MHIQPSVFGVNTDPKHDTIHVSTKSHTAYKLMNEMIQSVKRIASSAEWNALHNNWGELFS